jgi:hypothetical protein
MKCHIFLCFVLSFIVTVINAWSVAQDLSAQNSADIAVQTILDKYADSLKKLESKRIEQKVGGGLYAAALLNIIQVYKAKEDFETASKYNDRYIAMFSNDRIHTPLAKRDKLDMESQTAIQKIEKESGFCF